jgi:hypothetical protein
MTPLYHKVSSQQNTTRPTNTKNIQMFGGKTYFGNLGVDWR